MPNLIQCRRTNTNSIHSRLGDAPLGTEVEVVYDSVQQYNIPKKDEDIELKECPAYGESRENIDLSRCPAYGVV